LEEARKNFQDEVEGRQKKLAENEEKLENRRKLAHERKEKLYEDEIRTTYQLKTEIDGKLTTAEENFQRSMSERSMKLRSQLTKIDGNMEKCKEKLEKESEDHVQRLVEKMANKEELMQGWKNKQKKEAKEREAELATKEKRFVSNQYRIEEKSKDRMDEINERFKKVQENLEAKREADEKNRKLQQEFTRLKHQDKLENYGRLERQLQHDRLKVFDKEKEIQERIFWLATQKELSQQAKLEVAIQTKLERDRIDEAMSHLTKGAYGSDSNNVVATSHRKILKEILRPEDYKMLEEEKRKKKNENKSQHEHQERPNSSIKSNNLAKKAY